MVKTFDVTEVGIFTPKAVGRDFLRLVTLVILRLLSRRFRIPVSVIQLPWRQILQQSHYHGYKQMNPMVFAGLYPIESNKYNDLREALEKLQLNDASLAV